MHDIRRASTTPEMATILPALRVPQALVTRAKLAARPSGKQRSGLVLDKRRGLL